MKYTLMTTAVATIACTVPALAQTARPGQDERPRDPAASQRDAAPRFITLDTILDADITIRDTRPGQGRDPGRDAGRDPGRDAGRDMQRDTQSETIDLTDLVVDTRSGRAIYAIIDTKGTRGTDSRTVALPFDALSWDAAEESFTLRVTAEQLSNLPEFKTDELEKLSEPGWKSNIQSIFNLRPASDDVEHERGDEYTRSFASGTPATHKGTIASIRRAGSGSAERPGTPDRSDTPDRRGTPDRSDTPDRRGTPDRSDTPDRRGTPDRRSSASQHAHELTAIMIRIEGINEEQTVLLAPDSFLTRQSATFNAGDEVTITAVKAMNDEGKSVHVAQSIQSSGKTIQLRDRQGMPAWETAGTSTRSFHMLASKIDDCTLHAQGKELGSIDDVMVEVQSGTIAFMVISSGGTLGMGGDRHPVPFQAIRHGKDKNMYLDMPSVRFDNAPKFTQRGTEELNNAAFVKRVGDFYNIREMKFDTERASRWQQADSRNPQQRPERR